MKMHSVRRLAAALEFLAVATVILSVGVGPSLSHAAAADAGTTTGPKVAIIDPPERGFYSKLVDYHGIPIKAGSVVSDAAMFEAWRRVDMLMTNLPMVLSNLVAAGCELHIIGATQAVTDLPEWRQDKHVPLDEYQGLTRDVRTRGMGGLTSSFGEENLLRLPTDRYYDRNLGITRDICIHEFSHGIFGSGLPQSVRQMFLDQLKRSLDKGLWVNSYAASGTGGEFLSELTMWYWGSHGDLRMQGQEPENGREGLKKYDPESFALMDDLYHGKIEITKVEPRFRRQTTFTNNPATNAFAQRTPRDSVAARAIVARLTSYKVGETKLSEFLADAEMSSPTDHGTNGWYVMQRETATLAAAAEPDTYQFNVQFLNPSPGQRGGFGARGGASGTNSTVAQATNSPSGAGTNAVLAQGRRGGRGGAGARLPNFADLDFKAGVLTAFKWNN